MRKVKVIVPATRKVRRSKTQTSSIQVIARAAEILRLLGDSTGLSLAGIAESLALPRSTVHRIVLALAAERLVSFNGPGQYRLGPEITHLAERAKLDSIQDLHPYLVRLSRELDETVDLSILAGQFVAVVDQIISMRRLRVDAAVGRAFPLYCTASGKAILAALPESTSEALLSGPLESLTPKTITNRASLKAQLEQIRRTGIAFDREELTIGLCAIGSCLAIGAADIVAISIPVPAGRFYGQEDHLSSALSRFLTEVETAYPHIQRIFPGRMPLLKTKR